LGEEGILNAAILTAVVATGFLLWSPHIRARAVWRAMTTPLASIIGSGFLVLGPILTTAYGKFAPLAMCGLCLGAYLFGAAIRFNISELEKHSDASGHLVRGMEILASWTLGFAYIISVAYYLNLFGAFGVSLTPANSPWNAKLLTTAVFAPILYVGWTRGFRSLENMEYLSVTTKLAIIAGLVVGLAAYVIENGSHGEFFFVEPHITAWSAVTLSFGLIVTVQGFETSRYLGAEYDEQTRRLSMQLAQALSAGIYVTYILLITYIFPPDQFELSETAIVDMMKVVAPILPVLLVAAALAAQFSAAVADTSGSGGLVAELTGNRLTPRVGYVVLTAVGLLLTWSANVFEIIAYASRAFAAYYMLQAAIAAVRSARSSGRRMQTGLFVALSILGLLIVVLGRPVES